MRKWIFIIAALFFVCACHNSNAHSANGVSASGPSIIIPPIVVLSTDTDLHLVNGTLFYQQKKFSGTIKTFYSPGHLKARQNFYDGLEEGLSLTYYENGNKDSRRFYHDGEKDSVNQGWWINGNPRYEYHFKDGVYEGDFKEWYVNGKPLKLIIYHDGKEQSGIGWRENGKVYMSFVVKDGRLYGLINPNLCYSLKNERGEFVKSE